MKEKKTTYLLSIILFLSYNLVKWQVIITGLFSDHNIPVKQILPEWVSTE